MKVDNEARLTADIRVELAAYSPGPERITWLYEHLDLYIIPNYSRAPVC
jgi:hypothetical protein